MEIFLPNHHLLHIGLRLDKRLDKRNISEISPKDLLNIPKILKLNVDVYCKISSREFKKSIATYFTLIEAAGGIVKKQNKILFIFRNGKWDLPKGKIEMNEYKKNAAIREVQEETGLTAVCLKKKMADTFHIYLFENKSWILKITYWYEMACSPEQKLIPQIAEGITHIQWVDTNKLNSVLNNTYPLIKKLIAKYL